MAEVLRRFTRWRVARTVLVPWRTEALQLPAHVGGGPQPGRVVWKAPTLSALVRMLPHPTSAGVAVSGPDA